MSLRMPRQQLCKTRKKIQVRVSVSHSIGSFQNFLCLKSIRYIYICPRFKKGNLRLLQTEEGDWKLEELQEEKRRSLDGGNNSTTSNNNNNYNNNNNASFEDEEAEGEEEVVVRETPVKSRKERRKKSSQGSEEGGRSESQLLRR